MRRIVRTALRFALPALLASLVSVLAALPAFAADGSVDPGIPDMADVRARIARNGSTWTADDTWLRSLTPEARAHLTGFVPPPAYEETLRAHLKVLPVAKALPSSYDWRGTGGVTPVKNQGDCGACWAFACIGELEAFVKIYYGQELDLSESQILQCNPYGANCSGGWGGAAYSVMSSPGCVLEDCMPYDGGMHQNDPCNQASFLKYARITGWHSITNNVDQIKTAIMTYGPVVSNIDGAGDLQVYSGGCFNGGTPYTNHMIVIVGWDDRQCDNQGAWICKNSWGTGFGLAGYFYCQYGAAGIGTAVTQLEYSAPPAKFAVTAPLGSDQLIAGTQVPITWTMPQGSAASVDIWFNHAGRCFDEQIASGAPNSGTFLWTVPNEGTTAGQLVVFGHSGTLDGFGFNTQPLHIIGHRTRYVSVAGGNVAPYESPATAAHAISDAVLACTGRDSVLVAGGDYNENVAVNTTVQLYGGWNGAFTARDPALYPTRLQGFNSVVRLREGSADFGLVDGFTFHDSQGASYDQPAPGRHGGAILAIGCAPTIRNCRFENNRGDPGAGYGLGGAVMAYGGSPRIEGCTFTGNRATSGGAVALIATSGATLQGNVFVGNGGTDSTSSHVGGAVYVSGGSASLTGDQFTGNGGVYEGGAVAAENATVTLTGVQVAQGRAVQSGGGVLARGGSLTMERGSVKGNQAGSGGGGGVATENAAVTLRNVCATGNTTTGMGGGARLSGMLSGAIENCVVRGNSGGFGGGLFVNPSGAVTVRNNSVVGNSGGGLFGGGTGAATVDYNNVWNNTGGDYIGWLAGAHDAAGDPLCVNVAGGDYGLGLHSPCLDRGDPDPACADPDGSRADIGAHGGPGADVLAPAAVTGGAVTALGAGRWRVSWSASGAPDLARYVVYRDTAAVFAASAAKVAASVDQPATEWTDEGPVPDGAYYLVVAVDAAGHAGGYSAPLRPDLTGAPDGAAPRRFGIAAVVPNPFNPRTTVWFDLDAAGAATLAVYDLRGRLVRTLAAGPRQAGQHRADWDGRDERGNAAAAGVYLLRLAAGDRVQSVKVSLAK